MTEIGAKGIQSRTDPKLRIPNNKWTQWPVRNQLKKIFESSDDPEMDSTEWLQFISQLEAFSIISVAMLHIKIKLQFLPLPPSPPPFHFLSSYHNKIKYQISIGDVSESLSDGHGSKWKWNDQ